jgi:carbon storage regulator
MLVLTRSPSQEIRIGHDIIVRVLDVKGDRVRIGIDAPHEVSVHRQEVYQEITKANQDAARVKEPGLSEVLDLSRSKRGKKILGALRSPSPSPPKPEVNGGS